MNEERVDEERYVTTTLVIMYIGVVGIMIFWLFGGIALLSAFVATCVTCWLFWKSKGSRPKHSVGPFGQDY